VVQEQPSESTSDTLVEAGEAYASAHRAHAEAFVRYRASDPKRTDGQARAMADLDIDVTGAMVRWTVAQAQAQLRLVEIEYRMLTLQIAGARNAFEQPSSATWSHD
jgi:hypothetical protein